MRRSFLLILGLFQLTGCVDDICTQAAAKHTECTGEVVTALEGCDQAMAEYIVNQPCWALAGMGGKGEGESLCGRMYKCELQVTPIDTQFNGMKRMMPDSKLVVWVGEPAAGDPGKPQEKGLPIVVLHDPNDALAATVDAENKIVTETSFNSLQLSSCTTLVSARVKAGHRIAFWYEDRKHVLELSSIVSSAESARAAVSLGLYPSHEQMGEHDTYEQLADVMVGEDANVRVQLGSQPWMLEVGLADNAASEKKVSVTMDQCKDDICLTSTGQQETGPFLLASDSLHEPFKDKPVDVLRPIKINIETVTKGCVEGGTCFRLTLLGDEKPEPKQAETPTGNRPADLTLEIGAIDVNAATGSIKVNGAVSNAGDLPAGPVTITLSFTAEGGGAITPATVQLAEVKAGKNRWAYPAPGEAERTLNPGRYKVTASMTFNGGTQDRPQDFVVPARTSAKADLIPMLDENLQKDEATQKMTIKLFQVCNNGTISAVASEVKIVHVTKSGGGSVPERSLPVKALSASECHKFENTEFTVPPGSYTLKVIADSGSVVDETGEGVANEKTFDYTMGGTGAGTATETTTNGVDLRIGLVTPTVNGTNVSLKIQLCNDSSVQSMPSTLGLYLSSTKPSCNMPPAQPIQFPAVGGANKCVEMITQQPFQRPTAGFVWLFADSPCRITEADESNNFRQVTISPAADQKVAQQDTPLPGAGSDSCAVGGGSPTPSVIMLLTLLALRRRRPRPR